MTPPVRCRMSRRALLHRGALVLGAAALPIRLRAQEISPVMATLSSYMAAAKDRGLPTEVVEKAKHHILDTFAAMVSGSELPPGRAALALARAQAGRPVATVAGSNVVTGPMDAALVNGVLAHSDETDDSHGPSQSHPGASIVPAAFALGEELGVSGEHYLRAVTLGYDVGPAGIYPDYHNVQGTPAEVDNHDYPVPVFNHLITNCRRKWFFNKFDINSPHILLHYLFHRFFIILEPHRNGNIDDVRHVP